MKFLKPNETIIDIAILKILTCFPLKIPKEIEKLVNYMIHLKEKKRDEAFKVKYELEEFFKFFVSEFLQTDILR